jgi:hypothetical protein
MKMKTLFTIALTGVAAVCIAGIGVLSAGTAVQDVIRMENKAYSEREKGIVEFTHKKHVVDYKIGCGECHHDEKGQPLTSLKEGDNVQNCIECHSKTEKKPKGKLSKADKLAFHHEAIHDNCQGCHRDYNKKNNTKAAPTTCKECHPKK